METSNQELGTPDSRAALTATGCRRLWAAVMEQAVYDSKQSRRKPETIQARFWFRSKGSNAGTFQWCCSALDLDTAKCLAKLEELWA